MDLKFYTDLNPNQNEDLTRNFLNQVFQMMFNFIQKSNDRDEKILNFKQPQELKSLIDLDIPAESLPLQKIISDCSMVLKYAVKTAHPRFFNQLSQGLDLVSLAGEWITAVTNTNMFTYEITPVYNLIEEELLRKMRNIIGWRNHGDGIFNPGGSISNLYALQSARHFFYPELKEKGLFGMPKMVIFCSMHAHYSITRAASILGFGTEQVKLVPVDNRGKLIPSELERLIEESIENGEIPLMVSLTTGTTVLGAFDPIRPVATLCQKHRIWLHIDAAWGSGALLSSKRRHLFDGVELADSVTWNPHKVMGSLLQASAFLVKHENVLMQSNEMQASYLFQPDKHYDVQYDTGDKSIQCGRHVDAFKVWLMWRAKGDKGFEDHIEHLYDLAAYLYDQIGKRDNFEIVLSEPEYLNICFWYIPKSLRNLDKKSSEYINKLNSIAPKIKERMMLEGTLMVGYQPLDEKPNFFRMIVSNPASQKKDIDFLLDEIERLAFDL